MMQTFMKLFLLAIAMMTSLVAVDAKHMMMMMSTAPGTGSHPSRPSRSPGTTTSQMMMHPMMGGKKRAV
eukprot:CAMPEP_0172449580 /NCGR_PEP_ID=MMETSP1065-20121228/8257_1 /TAXON_ID=265537 /ORGANISM="Amphiprora paludosa, Strain CCMP125" /LENGTH=68 /DNA_ID=CAMNT_0013201285 /DNA_START=118 /DNA_END=324 /DNA_ORIENTATION=+